MGKRGYVDYKWLPQVIQQARRGLKTEPRRCNTRFCNTSQHFPLFLFFTQMPLQIELYSFSCLPVILMPFQFGKL